MPATPDLTDVERAELVAVLREKIAADAYPMSPHIRRLRAILDKLEPPPPRTPPYPRGKPAGTPSAVLAKMRSPRRGR